MPAISSTVSGTHATSRRNHWYCSRPTGTAGGRSARRSASLAPNCSRAAPASAPAEASSAAAEGSILVSASVQASIRAATPSSSATASLANSRAGLASASAACESVSGTARSSRVTSATRPASTPGRSRASYTGPSAWSVQNLGIPRTRRMSLSHLTRAIAELSSRWSTRSDTSSGSMRASSASNAPSSSRRRSARPASTSGSQPDGRSRRGMSSRVLGCWRARQAQNRSPRSSSSRMHRACRVRERLRNPGRSCHPVVSHLQQNRLDLRRASVGTFAYLCVSRLAISGPAIKGEEGLCNVISGWHRGA